MAMTCVDNIYVITCVLIYFIICVKSSESNAGVFLPFVLIIRPKRHQFQFILQMFIVVVFS